MDGLMVFDRRRQCAPHLIVFSWTHSSPNPKRHLDRFSRFCTAHTAASLCFTMSRRPLKIAPFHRGVGPHLMHDSLGPPKYSTQTVSRSVQPFLQAHHCDRRPTDRQTDRQTDRPRYLIGNNRPHLRYVVLRCGLIILLLFLLTTTRL